MAYESLGRYLCHSLTHTLSLTHTHEIETKAIDRWRESSRDQELERSRGREQRAATKRMSDRERLADLNDPLRPSAKSPSDLRSDPTSPDVRLAPLSNHPTPSTPIPTGVSTCHRLARSPETRFKLSLKASLKHSDHPLCCCRCRRRISCCCCCSPSSSLEPQPSSGSSP